MRHWAVLAALAVLAGCGGGSGGGAGGTSFNGLVQENQAFFQKYARDGTIEDNVTPVAAIPRTATLTYRGAVLMWAGTDIDAEIDDPKLSDVDAAARLELTARPMLGTVTGSISDFRNPAGKQPVSGDLLVNGDVRGNVFTADVVGSMTHEGRMDRTQGELFGSFVGPRADGIAGIGAGSIGTTKSYFLLYTGNRVQ